MNFLRWIANLWGGKPEQAEDAPVDALNDRFEEREEAEAPRRAERIEQARDWGNARKERLGLPPLAPLDADTPDAPVLPVEPVGDVVPTPAPEEVDEVGPPPGLAPNREEVFPSEEESQPPEPTAPTPAPDPFNEPDVMIPEPPDEPDVMIDEPLRPEAATEQAETQQPVESQGDFSQLVEVLERIDESTKQATEATKAGQEAVEQSQGILEGIQEAIQQQEQQPTGYGR